MKKLLISLAALFSLIGCQPKSEQGNNTKPGIDTLQVLREAYEFGLPMIMIDITKRQSTNALEPRSVPLNTFGHMSVFPDANFKSVVRANADTYYSPAILDLEKEPVVLSVPDTKARYYMMPILDAYSNVFASPGTRTTGNKSGVFLITGPQWQGEVPDGMQQIKSPTNMAWLIGRTQVNSEEDGNKVVVPLQKQYQLTPLSAYGKAYTPPATQADSTAPKGRPNDVVKNMSIEDFFNLMCKLMVTNPPAERDKAAMEKFALVGIKPGATFDLNKFTGATSGDQENS